MTSLNRNMFRVSLLALIATTTLGLPIYGVSLGNLPLFDKALTPCYLNMEASLAPRAETQKRVSGGVTGGAVAGSVVGLAIIALGIFLIIRHKSRSNAMPAASESEELPRTSSTTKFPEQSTEMSPIRGQQYPPSEAYNVPQELYGSEPLSHEHRASPAIVFELDAGERS